MTTDSIYQRIIENSNVIGWEANPTTFEFIYTSRYAETVLGYPLEKWKEPGFWSSLIHPDDVDRAVSYCQDNTAKLISHEFEYRMLTADGRTVWIRDIAAVESDKGRPVRLYGVMIDITAEKEAMAALAQARDDARQADRAKTRFLANISHELRTPMNAIVGFTDFLLQRETLSKKPIDLDEYLGLIKSSASHLGTLIDDLLELSRYEIGVNSLKLELVDLNEILSECFSMLSGLADSKKIKLKNELPAIPIRIEADRKGLKQVVINLLNNALKFTLPNGTVKVFVNSEGTSERETVTIVVEDTGIGMKQENSNVQYHNAELSDAALQQYRDENSGIGLGLSIINAVVRLHEGQLTFTEWPEGGTRAEVKLPIRQTLAAKTE